MKGWKKIKTWFSGNHVPIKEEINIEDVSMAREYGESLRHRELLEEQMMAQAQMEAYREEREERAGWTPAEAYLHWGREGERIQTPLPPISLHDTTLQDMMDARRREMQEEVASRTRDMMREDYVAQPIDRRPNHPEINETRNALWEIKRKRINIPKGIFRTKVHECEYYGFCGEKTDTVHPDYPEKYICKKCLTIRNKYEVY